MSTGILQTNNLPTDLAKKSFAGMITRLMPNGAAPLFGMTSMLGDERAVQTEHGYFAKTMLFPEMQASVAAVAADTLLSVVSTTNVLPGMIMRVQPTGENIIINNIVSPVQVAISRGVGTVAAGAIALNARLYQVGSAFEESSIRPNALNINPVRITNLTQIFRNTWAISDTMRETMVIAGETNVAESKQDCAMFHAADIEKALFFGQRSQGTRNGNPFRTMNGLIPVIGNLANYPSYYTVPNSFAAGATTNYTQLEGFLDPVFNQSTDPKVANERVLFCGGIAKRVINNIGRVNGTYQLVDGQTNWGMQFATFKTARGTFRLIEHPLFNSNLDWSAMAVGVDLSSFKVAYLGDRKTQSKDFNSGSEAQDNGIDAVGGTLTTELTTVIKNPPANTVITGFTAAAIG